MIGLEELGASPDVQQVGGKALQLGRLMAAGLPVPDGGVVPVARFERALRDGGLWRAAQAIARGDLDDAPALCSAIAALTWPSDERAEMVAAARRLGPKLAVRSSGVDEDGHHRSFAGQHHTALGVAPDAVPQAVLACWASLYTHHALAYRSGRGPRPGTLAVVIQPMVDPTCSGVMFTVNPLSGSWREMVVEAVWGLGEGLVSGQLAPHWYLVRRPRRLPQPVQRLWARVRLQVMQEDLPELPEYFVASDDGVVRRPTPDGLRHRRTLDRPALRRLCRLGLRVERTLGEPQDVEWGLDKQGRFVLLQARPITSGGTPRTRDDVLWTRRFIGERWPEPATPLGWSILRPILDSFIAYPATQAAYLGGGPALKLVNSRPYINTTVFRHLAFKLPGSPPPRFMLELVPPAEEQAWRTRFAVAPHLAVYASILRTTLQERRWQRFRWNPFTNALRWDQFVDRLQAELPALSRAPESPEDAIVRVNAQIGWIRDYCGIHVCSLLFANIFYQLLEGALGAWLPEQRAELMAHLATCPPGNLTVETNSALHALGQLATDADLELLAAGDPPDPDRPFGVALDGFITRFGHRAEASWELMSPRWGRHPERLEPLLRAQRTVRAEAPDARAARQQEATAAAMHTLQHAAAGAGGAELTVLKGLVHYTRQYLLLRENQRFWFDRLLSATQETLLWLGAHAVEQGWLSDAGDIAYVSWDEVQGLVASTVEPDDISARVRARRTERQADLQREPPTFLVGDDPGEAPADAGRLQGLGISAGRARGRVRVLHRLADGVLLQPGEVLVTRAVDPGWTPLFLTASAVVLELGSVLSHGAVVAREYGVPAVVNLEGITSRLQDGQEVTVDGTRGMVWVHA